MNLQIEIDSGSGFCFGVTRAIRLAEEKLASPERLYCLGDIVHNGRECERLARMGLRTINHRELAQLSGARVLLRAHGEPPSTYQTARRNNIRIIDATCPVVLQLQRRIAQEYKAPGDKQIAIFGKPGHAEVLGLVGQAGGDAAVIGNAGDARRLDFRRPVRLYSQTTRDPGEFRRIAEYIAARMQPPAALEWHDTICRQVANRLPAIQAFAARHDVVLFVCGDKSSNGRMLFSACRKVNSRTHIIRQPSDIDYTWLAGARTAGVCGATSTPKWLMEACRAAILAR